MTARLERITLKAMLLRGEKTSREWIASWIYTMWRIKTELRPVRLYRR